MVALVTERAPSPRWTEDRAGKAANTKRFALVRQVEIGNTFKDDVVPEVIVDGKATFRRSQCGGYLVRRPGGQYVCVAMYIKAAALVLPPPTVPASPPIE